MLVNILLARGQKVTRRSASQTSVLLGAPLALLSVLNEPSKHVASTVAHAILRQNYHAAVLHSSETLTWSY